jgi:hypothetical protein
MMAKVRLRFGSEGDKFKVAPSFSSSTPSFVKNYDCRFYNDLASCVAIHGAPGHVFWPLYLLVILRQSTILGAPQKFVTATTN